MDGKGNVQIAEYEFCDRLDACLEDLRGGDRSFPITVPPPPSRIKKAIKRGQSNERRIYLDKQRISQTAS